jgi:hypothetical protein
MGDGRMRSDKVMLPESMMRQPAQLRAWIARAFDAASRLPKKLPKKAAKKVATTKAAARKKPGAKRR